ncbi:MAG: TonB-dependent receptor [Halieaceae bacterium]|jgi:outer membrane receptor protein involved in Fe transport|nr:TonB-dependent receptor [Halieaceae bacterium]
MKYTTPLLAAACCLASQALADPTRLEEVVVTAELRPAPLLSQAGSISVISARDIREREAQHLEGILSLAPNVNFAGGTSRARFFQIRGVGERSQFQEPLNPSIGLVIDGIDFSGLGGAGTLFDVQQVEILRGPQGTLHGANALAGLIDVRSGQPETEPGLQLEAGAADYNTWNAGVVGTGPLVTDRLLYRLAVNRFHSDGFISNDYLGRDDTNGQDETTIRGKLRWLPTGRDTLDLTAMYIDIDNGYDAFSLDNTRHTLSDEPGKDRQDSRALGLEWQRELDSLTLETALTGATTASTYSFDEDWSYVGIAPGWEYSSKDRYKRDRDSYSATARLLSGEGSRLFRDSTDWVAGAYFLGDRENLERRYTYLENDFSSRYDTDTYALFGQLDSQLGGGFKLITGLRIERRLTDYRDNNGVDSDPDKDLWGGRVALEYPFDDNRMGYGEVSRGYRANGVNAAILASAGSSDDPAITDQLRALQQFDEEYLLNYELGFKGKLLADTLQARLALFYMDRDDQQVKGSLVIPRPDGSTAFIDYTSNAAQGNNYGAELELNWLTGDALELFANIGLLHTEFERYIDADGNDLSGRDQAQAPNYQYAVGGQYDIGRGFYLRIDVEGRDSAYFSDRHDLKAPSYELLNMRLGYAGPRWSVALWARNLSDEDYYVRGFGTFGNDPRKEYAVEPYYQYGEPRVVGMSTRFTF